MITATRSTTSLTAVERREEAFQLIDEIKSKMAAGAEFPYPFASELYSSMRDSLKKWGPNARVSPDQLKGLRKINVRMRGKKK